MKIPEVGLGTWELHGKECTKVVQLALELGYRHIDTAHAYENHKAIGQALKNFDRHQLFITSKISLEDQIDSKHLDPSVEKACDLALQELNTEYLDLFLIHWPHDLHNLAVFRALERLKHKGKIHRAGVSNFNIHYLEDLRKEGFTPSVNQVEFHPYLYQQELLEYCRKHHIELIAYRPFGKGALLHDPLLVKIAGHYKKTASQVILRWLMQKRIPVIPKASSEEHLRHNLSIFDFALSDADMQQIDSLNKNQRFCMPDAPAFKY